MKKLLTLTFLTLSMGAFANHSISDREANTLITFSPFITTASPFLSTTDSIKHREEAEVVLEDISIFEVSGEPSERLRNSLELVMEQEDLNADEALVFLINNAANILE